MKVQAVDFLDNSKSVDVSWANEIVFGEGRSKISIGMNPDGSINVRGKEGRLIITPYATNFIKVESPGHF